MVIVRRERFFAVNFFVNFAEKFVWDDDNGDADEKRGVDDKLSFLDELSPVIKRHCGCNLNESRRFFYFGPFVLRSSVAQDFVHREFLHKRAEVAPDDGIC